MNNDQSPQELPSQFQIGGREAWRQPYRVRRKIFRGKLLDETCRNVFKGTVVSIAKSGRTSIKWDDDAPLFRLRSTVDPENLELIAECGDLIL